MTFSNNFYTFFTGMWWTIKLVGLIITIINAITFENVLYAFVTIALKLIFTAFMWVYENSSAITFRAYKYL